MKESDLYLPVKNLFSLEGYEVYSEVEGKWFRKRADMVATKGDELLVIELKKSLSFQLVDQARFWLRFADFVYIAVPKSKKERSYTALEILSVLGVGLIEVDVVKFELEKNRSKNEYLDFSKYGNIVIEPKRNEVSSRDRHQFDNLTEEHKTWAIGGSTSKNSKYVTSYSLLMNDVYQFLREQLHNPSNDGWVSHREIYEHLQQNSRDSVKRHYKGKNPANSLKQALITYEFEELEFITLKGKWYCKILPESNKYLNMGKD